MPEFRFYYPIQIRYGDLDPQGHVNNARIVTYIEQARVAHLQELKLWDGQSFLDLGLIVADVHVSYLAPVHLNQPVHVGLRVSRLGNKSITFDYLLENRATLAVLAKGETVMVAYDYHQDASIPVPDAWREKIANFEAISART